MLVRLQYRTQLFPGFPLAIAFQFPEPKRWERTTAVCVYLFVRFPAALFLRLLKSSGCSDLSALSCALHRSVLNPVRARGQFFRRLCPKMATEPLL